MKNELQSLQLFSHLFPHIYRENEWGDMDDCLEEWSGELWGVTGVKTHGVLFPSELTELTEWLSGQLTNQ